jgi:hypothetical protein
MTKRDDPTYLIWSNEHRAWWMPGNRGYSEKLTEAGGYSRSAAMAISNPPPTAMPLTAAMTGVARSGSSGKPPKPPTP